VVTGQQAGQDLVRRQGLEAGRGFEHGEIRTKGCAARDDDRL